MTTNSEKPKQIQNRQSARLFQINVTLLLGSFTLILLLMQVPWMYVLEPFALILLLMQVPWIVYALEPLMELIYALLFQLFGIVFIPSFIFFVAVATMIGLVFGQYAFITALAKERGETLSSWNKISLFVPILRYWTLWSLLANSTPISALLMVGGSVMFWVLALVVSPQSPWVMLSFAVSVGAWFTIAKRLSNGVCKSLHKIWGVVLLCVFVVSSTAGYVTFYRTKKDIKAEKSMLQSVGIPTSREELKQHFYQSRPLNTEFVKLVDRYADNKEKRSSDCLVSASDYYRLPESKRTELKAYLASELCREDFKDIDALIETGESLKYQMSFPDNLLETLLLHLSFYRPVMRYFSSRIVVALEMNNSDEAMRLFRLSNKFQENVFQSDFLVGATVAFACEAIRDDSVGAMLGSGLLSEANLLELLELNRNREEKLRATMQHGLRGEAYSVIDCIILVNTSFYEFRSCILDAGKTNSQNSYFEGVGQLSDPGKFVDGGGSAALSALCHAPPAGDCTVF
ncbi:MAG: hypothetical protein GX561_04230 [Lentisphaerae bacterium]|mgnify:CR=1 FL=1|jgi:hypothetical protein|nr:hypothetical protein [Lentisphaerota bacterium]